MRLKSRLLCVRVPARSRRLLSQRLIPPFHLGEYSQLVPASEYHYYEDSSKSVFYKDESRTEILLECDIIGRLHDNVEDQADKLVYRNDRYMAVFSRIDDKGSAGGPAFTTSYVMLLRKP